MMIPPNLIAATRVTPRAESEAIFGISLLMENLCQDTEVQQELDFIFMDAEIDAENSALPHSSKHIDILKSEFLKAVALSSTRLTTQLDEKMFDLEEMSLHLETTMFESHDKIEPELAKSLQAQRR